MKNWRSNEIRSIWSAFPLFLSTFVLNGCAKMPSANKLCRKRRLKTNARRSLISFAFQGHFYAHAILCTFLWYLPKVSGNLRKNSSEFREFSNWNPINSINWCIQLFQVLCLVYLLRILLYVDGHNALKWPKIHHFQIKFGFNWVPANKHNINYLVHFKNFGCYCNNHTMAQTNPIRRMV